MKQVSFISVEDDGTDLILSFSVYDSDPGYRESLILMRTPVYENILDEHEHGVSVSFKNYEEDCHLKSVLLGKDVIEISDEEHKYVLDMRHIEKEDLYEMEVILKKMNFDNRFTIGHV